MSCFFLLFCFVSFKYNLGLHGNLPREASPGSRTSPACSGSCRLFSLSWACIYVVSGEREETPGRVKITHPGLEAQLPACRREERGCRPVTGKDRAGCQSGGAPALRPGAVAQNPGREASLAWASLAQRFPASSVLAREGAGCGSVGDVPGAWLASAPLSPSLWT